MDINIYIPENEDYHRRVLYYVEIPDELIDLLKRIADGVEKLASSSNFNDAMEIYKGAGEPRK